MSHCRGRGPQRSPWSLKENSPLCLVPKVNRLWAVTCSGRKGRLLPSPPRKAGPTRRWRCRDPASSEDGQAQAHVPSKALTEAGGGRRFLPWAEDAPPQTLPDPSQRDQSCISPPFSCGRDWDKGWAAGRPRPQFYGGGGGLSEAGGGSPGVAAPQVARVEKTHSPSPSSCCLGAGEGGGWGRGRLGVPESLSSDLPVPHERQPWEATSWRRRRGARAGGLWPLRTCVATALQDLQGRAAVTGASSQMDFGTADCTHVRDKATCGSRSHPL